MNKGYAVRSLAICALLARCAWGSPDFTIAPKEFQKGSSVYRLPPSLQIHCTAKAKNKLWILARELEGTTFSLRISTIKKAPFELVRLGDANYEARRFEVPPRPEGYLLEVAPSGFFLMGRDEQAIQWGLLRLREVIDLKKKTIPTLFVRDWPDVSWRAVHLRMPPEAQLTPFRRFVDEVVLPYHFNAVVLEVNYRFRYKSHPEIEDPDAPSADFCRDVGEFLSARGVRLIPEFNCIGHQSGKSRTGPLLRAYPEFDETPSLPHGDDRLEQRCWCPRHPKLTPLLYDLWSELVHTFRSSHFHIGADQVFHIAEKECPRCRHSSPGEVFTAAIMQYHGFLRGKDNTVLMWGDRLLNARTLGYSKYEASFLDTFKALSVLPRDMIICDWHLSVRDDYPSLTLFQEQGFRTLACPSRDTRSVRSVWEYARRTRTNLFLGFLATTGVEFSDLAAALFRGAGRKEAQEAAASLKLVGKLGWQGKE